MPKKRKHELYRFYVVLKWNYKWFWIQEVIVSADYPLFNMNMSGDWRKFIGSFKWLSSSFKSSRELGLSVARPASRFHSSTLFFTFSNISSVQGRISCTVPKHFKPNAEQKFTFKKKSHSYIIRNSLGLSDFFSRDNASCEICSNRELPYPTPISGKRMRGVVMFFSLRVKYCLCLTCIFGSSFLLSLSKRGIGLSPMSFSLSPWKIQLVFNENRKLTYFIINIRCFAFFRKLSTLV